MTTTNNHIGLYIHVPFCIRKCKYCSFLSFECGDESVLSEYADALIMEIRQRCEEWPYRVVDSIYIGGGTPSLMAAKDMARIVKAVREGFFVGEGCEITIEANPATLTIEKMSTYLDCGINRISIGAQSFDNSILRMLGRLHDKNEALSAIRDAKKVGFKNINVDMMFGIPGQTPKMWRDSIRQCVFMGPEHISLYSLQIEEGTPFYQMVYEDKIIKEIPEFMDRNMYHEAISLMEDHGYHQYEISNCARPGFESRHNMKYWSYDEYLGLGPGASSFIGGHRFRNTTDVMEYLKYIQAGLPPVKKEDVENYSKRDEMGIYMFTGLRKKTGVSIPAFERLFGEDFFSVFNVEILSKYRGFIETDGDYLRLTEKGFDVSNKIMAAFV